jgi:hypothetical protein
VFTKNILNLGFAKIKFTFFIIAFFWKKASNSFFLEKSKQTKPLFQMIAQWTGLSKNNKIIKIKDFYYFIIFISPHLYSAVI